jgi:hypothetical protein
MMGAAERSASKARYPGIDVASVTPATAGFGVDSAVPAGLRCSLWGGSVGSAAGGRVASDRAPRFGSRRRDAVRTVQTITR